MQLMGIESSAEHGGAESSFTSAIIAIEELARVDPSVSVMCDVHNTLVNTVIRKYGNKEQQDKWLPSLSETTVSRPFRCHMTGRLTTSAAWVLLPLRAGVRLGRICLTDEGCQGWQRVGD
jgi:hypothetical protein